MDKEFPNIDIDYLGVSPHRAIVVRDWNYSLSEEDVEAGNRLRIVLQRDWAAIDEWRNDCREIEGRKWFKWLRIFCVPTDRVISISSQFVDHLDLRAGE